MKAKNDILPMWGVMRAHFEVGMVRHYNASRAAGVKYHTYLETEAAIINLFMHEDDTERIRLHPKGSPWTAWVVNIQRCRKSKFGKTLYDYQYHMCAWGVFEAKVQVHIENLKANHFKHLNEAKVTCFDQVVNTIGFEHINIFDFTNRLNGK